MLEYLNDFRGRAARWFADQQMNVIGHKHVTHQCKLEPRADFSEDLRRDISAADGGKELSALVASESNKMKIAAAGDSCETVWHRERKTEPTLADPARVGHPRGYTPQLRPIAVCSHRSMSVKKKSTGISVPPANVMAHAIGHVFGLGDLKDSQAAGPTGNADGNNLMCSENAQFCADPAHSGTYLGPDQTKNAGKGIRIWKK